VGPLLGQGAALNGGATLEKKRDRMKTLDASDHRALRVYLTADDYGLHEGPAYEPKGALPEETWRSLTSLTDNAVLQTTDYYSNAVETLNDMAQSWLDIHDGVPEKTPLRMQCLAVHDGFQGSLFNAIHAWYRIAGITLRCAFEDMLIGMYYQDKPDRWPEFQEVITGKARSPQRREVDTELLRHMPQDLLNRANRLYQDELSVYVHRISEGEIWESNGPLFRHEALELWIRQFDQAFRLLCEMIDCIVPGTKASELAAEIRLRTTSELEVENK
jgi:hypothetical protein